MDVLDVVVGLFVRIAEAFTRLLGGLMQVFESDLRAPMAHLHIPYPLQTTGLALVPALSLIVVVRMMRGFLRVGLALLLLGWFGYVAWPPFSSLFA